MSDRIRRLVHEMGQLEQELLEALHQQETRVLFEIHGASVRFSPEAQKAHEERRRGLIAWLLSSDLRNGLSAPFIYGLALPMMLYDLCLSGYQAICFRLYRIPRVERSRYIVMDRHHLGYLNSIEKLNCVYCGYANGLLAYATEITARTEQYWCPIKHAHKLMGAHRRYSQFFDFGDASGYEEGAQRLRDELRSEQGES